MTVSLETHMGAADLDSWLRGDVAAGLAASPKWLPPKWFYDAQGSRLFEQITTLAEYYPTRTEREVLTAQAARIATVTGAKTLIELGSGSSDKTRLLLEALRAHGTLVGFVPFDVSQAALREAVDALAVDYPELNLHGIVGDFTKHLRHLPHGSDRLVAFLGGTIGNLLPGQRASFLSELRSHLEPGEWLLLGADLVKDPAVLVPAYDDASGVTAQFNRNVLRVLNRRLDADFEPADFDHVAVWNARDEWIEMRLRARRDMRINIPPLDLAVDFAAGEQLLTEVSAKFRPAGLSAELSAAGFTMRHWWTDSGEHFSLTLAEAT